MLELQYGVHGKTTSRVSLLMPTYLPDEDGGLQSVEHPLRTHTTDKASAISFLPTTPPQMANLYTQPFVTSPWSFYVA